MSQLHMYWLMVKNLFKVDGFNDNPNAALLVHAALGITGECAEILFAFMSENKKNLIEEIGDCYFYCQAILNWLKEEGVIDSEDFAVDVSKIDQDKLRKDEESFNNILLGIQPASNNRVRKVSRLVYRSGELQDKIKKFWAYRDSRITPLTIFEDLKLVIYYLQSFTESVSLDFDFCREANMEKLVLGPNARYPDGLYTDSLATERRDKQNEAD